MADVGGIPIAIDTGLAYKGTVTSIPGANQFTVPAFIGLGAGKFDGAANPYSAFIFRKGDGSGLPPQGEIQLVTAFNTQTGVVTTPAFTVPVAINDEIILVNPSLANAIVMPVVISAVLREQADVDVNVGATNPGEVNVLNLVVAGTKYLVRKLRIKSADPGVGQTVTVRLYETVNGIFPTLVASFIIDHTNFATYYSLMDMFGVPHLAGSQLRVTVLASVVGPIVVTGEYQYATAT